MFDSFNGIPLHPLVVHGVVVLLPLAILGTVLIAIRPRWRTRYGPLVVAAALIATVLVPVATSSGESLEKRVGDPGEHAELGDQLLWFALALLVTSAALVVLEWRAERTERDVVNSATDAPVHATRNSPARYWLAASAGAAIVAALACGVQVYRVGDSGARAAWGDTPASSTGP